MCYVNPATLLFTTKKLYRDALRLASYLGARNGNAKVVKEQVRQKFKKHMHETDPEKIEALKRDAVRGLSNYLFYEAQRMAKASSAVMNRFKNSFSVARRDKSEAVVMCKKRHFERCLNLRPGSCVRSFWHRRQCGCSAIDEGEGVVFKVGSVSRSRRRLSLASSSEENPRDETSFGSAESALFHVHSFSNVTSGDTTCLQNGVYEETEAFCVFRLSRSSRQPQLNRRDLWQSALVFKYSSLQVRF